jgi:hypothetical protein
MLLSELSEMLERSLVFCKQRAGVRIPSRPPRISPMCRVAQGTNNLRVKKKAKSASNNKIKKSRVLQLVSHRSQRATLSFPQLYRICTELPEHTVLYRFPPFTCFIPSVPPFRCFFHVASNSGETTHLSVFAKGKFRK